MDSRVIGVLLLAVALAACAPARGTREVYAPRDELSTAPAERGAPGQPRPYGEMAPPGVLPRTAQDVSGPAALALLDQWREALETGQTDQAVAALERGLRIEPRNPFLWQALAGTYLKQGLYDQAENVAQKSNSLARGNPYIEIENWRLIAKARQQKGDADGARMAAERMADLQAQLED